MSTAVLHLKTWNTDIHTHAQVAASEAPKAGLEAQHKAEQNALALARLREEMTVTERDLRDTRKQVSIRG